MTEKQESAADKAIREALESVERLEREARGEKVERKSNESAGSDGATEGEAVSFAETETPAAAGQPASPARKSSSDALLEATIKAKQELQEILNQTQKEAKDLFDRLARVSADYDNFKKRVVREKQDAIKFANESVFKELLPVLDNMLRAVAASSSSDSATLLEGVKLVAKQFEDTMGKMGIVGFSALHEPFDPARHEAVGARPDDKVPTQHVCEEYQRGYMLHDRLLRPALVIVSSGAPVEN